MEIIDADGHVNERPFIDELLKFMPRGGQNPPLFSPFRSLAQLLSQSRWALLRKDHVKRMA